MLIMGTHSDPNKGLLTIPEPDLLYHTAVIGQAGSGKSYFLARLLEEIGLRTRARIVILDPNGDFSRFHAPRQKDFWEKPPFASKLQSLKKQTRSDYISYDDHDSFCARWTLRRFQFVTAGIEDRAPIRVGANQAPLLLHWKWLGNEQDFLLDVDSIKYPKIQQGVVTCHHYLNENRHDYPQGHSLPDLEEVAEYFGSKRVIMAQYPEAHALTEEDWLAVRLQFRQLRKKFYRIWFKGKLKGLGRVPTDLCGHIRNGFRENDPWQMCVVGLAGAKVDDMLLAADATLYVLWNSAVGAWRVAQKQVSEADSATVRPHQADQAPTSVTDPVSLAESDDEDLVADSDDALQLSDQRVPTIIVVDEAHNFAPQEPATALQARVSDRIATIAAEGRKYGLFLLFATQRPQKLRKGLLSECENSCLLRIQSKIERSYAAEALGVPTETVDHVGRFTKGQALMSRTVGCRRPDR